MIHLFIFNNASRAANYGIGTYTRQLSDCLCKWDKAKVSFVDINAATKEFLITEDELGRVHYQIPTLSTRKESDNDCRIIFYLLARHIDKVESDNLVFQFNYFQHRQLAELLKGHYINSRIILTVHYLGWCFELKGNHTTFQKVISRDGNIEENVRQRVIASFEEEKKFLYLADEVLVLSNRTKTILNEEYKVSNTKLHVVYNGLEGSCILRHESSSIPRNIVFVGRLDEIKGVEYLIKAFKEIVSKYKDTHLVIVGEGNFQPYLSLCCDIHERVSFLGKISSEELEEIYQSAYIGMLPSFHEQCSYSMIEMMRHGIPVIGTDSTGLSEMLDSIPHMRVSINEDEFDADEHVTQLAVRLDTLLSNDAAYLEASRAMSSIFQERYQASSMLQRFQDILLFSFSRPNYIVSSDYFIQMDYRMFQLINQQPDIDADFFGLSGIGIYLWWRVQNLHQQENKYHLSMIQEYLIYYLDWLLEVSESVLLPNEMISTLYNMKQAGFYKNVVTELLGKQQSVHNGEMPAEKGIIQNTIKICNCKI